MKTGFSRLLLALPTMVPLRLRRLVMETRLKELVRPIYRSVTNSDVIQTVNLQAPLDGFKMHINPRWDLRFVYGVYEPLLCDAIRRIVKPGWVCMDIGAYAGYLSMLMAKGVGTAGKVIAFEPLPTNYEVLTGNVALNKLEHNIVCERFALAAAAGQETFTFRTDALCGAGSLVNTAPTGNASLAVITVDTISGDEYLTQRFPELHIDFMKIDVEGAEALILEGIKNTLRRDRPQILLETHHHFRGNTSTQALSILRDNGYTIQPLHDKSHLLALPDKGRDGP